VKYKPASLNQECDKSGLRGFDFEARWQCSRGIKRDHPCILGMRESHFVSARKEKRIILETLRTVMRPITAAHICGAVMKARNLYANDKALCRLTMKRTSANLKHWQRKLSPIRAMPGPGQ
jgi:hypothetical protein